MCYKEESKLKITRETLGPSVLDCQGRSLSGAAYSKRGVRDQDKNTCRQKGFQAGEK